MKKEIKERIEAVRRGEVPEGYRRTRAGLMPLEWRGDLAAKDVFRNHTNKKHNGEFQVLSATQDRGIIPRSEVDIDIKYAEENIGSYKKVDPGDFVISLRSFQGGIEYSEYEGLVSPAYTVLKATKPIIDNFYRAYFKTPDFISRLNGAVYGIRDGKQIGFDDFGDLAIHYPSVEEQQKIAEILATCDRAIELKREEVDGVNKLKRSLNNLLFPCSGENAPMLRFPGFGEGWQRQKLLSCIEKITDFRGRTPKKLGMEWSEDGYLALSALNVKDGYIDFSQDVHYGDEALYSKWMRGNELHKGQVVFTTEAPMGNVAQIPDDRGYILSQRTIAFDVKEAVITEDFLAILLRTPTVLAALNALSTGGTAKGVSQRTLADLDVVIPTDLREQEAIAALFTNLNKLIRLHQQELEEQQNKKQALMQLLLTGLVRV